MSEPLACIVVDDPCLSRHYGFIDFSMFLDWLNDEDLASTFAFIPWNYRRTDPTTANLFINNPYRLSICVHGCDHTKGEFASTDRLYLEGICALARKRMMDHERIYGVPWDNVMVFPQGKFSPEAMHALRSTGYLAAVNSIDASCEYNMSRQYVTEFGFPLITRRYPINIDDFVYDSEAGKPILIVQHHSDFADGFVRLTKFTRELKRRVTGIKWMPIGHIVSSMGLKPQPLNHCQPIHQTKRERAIIALRRHLCEFRDNYVHSLKRNLSILYFILLFSA